MTDIKQICARLIELWDADCDINVEINELRAALAEPEPEGPTDDDLWDIGERHLWTGTDESVTNDRILTSFIEAARAVLARWGNYPASPDSSTSPRSENV